MAQPKSPPLTRPHVRLRSQLVSEKTVHWPSLPDSPNSHKTRSFPIGIGRNVQGYECLELFTRAGGSKISSGTTRAIAEEPSNIDCSQRSNG